jgi:hypothetical protein
MYAPQVDLTEALHTMGLHFIGCIRDGSVPITDGHAGLRVVSALEAATRSMRNHGAVERLARWSVPRLAATA